MAKTDQTDAVPETIVGPDEPTEAVHEFYCPVCENKFTAKKETAVCNGLNVLADERGKPILDDDDNVQIFDLKTKRSALDERKNLIRGAGHGAREMEKRPVKTATEVK